MSVTYTNDSSAPTERDLAQIEALEQMLEQLRVWVPIRGGWTSWAHCLELRLLNVIDALGAFQSSDHPFGNDDAWCDLVNEIDKIHRELVDEGVIEF